MSGHKIEPGGGPGGVPGGLRWHDRITPAMVDRAAIGLVALVVLAMLLALGLLSGCASAAGGGRGGSTVDIGGAQSQVSGEQEARRHGTRTVWRWMVISPEASPESSPAEPGSAEAEKPTTGAGAGPASHDAGPACEGCDACDPWGDSWAMDRAAVRIIAASAPKRDRAAEAEAAQRAEMAPMALPHGIPAGALPPGMMPPGVDPRTPVLAGEFVFEDFGDKHSASGSGSATGPRARLRGDDVRVPGMSFAPSIISIPGLTAPGRAEGGGLGLVSDLSTAHAPSIVLLALGGVLIVIGAAVALLVKPRPLTLAAGIAGTGLALIVIDVIRTEYPWVAGVIGVAGAAAIGWFVFRRLSTAHVEHEALKAVVAGVQNAGVAAQAVKQEVGKVMKTRGPAAYGALNRAVDSVKP